ncbi:MAG: cupin domain-containing protein, partial [Burkholderiales bacterium]|nr:cupin domain-containing protein [Burkholderiales bacterium]
LYDKEHVFINGQAFAMTGSVRTNLRALADRRTLSASSIARSKSKPVLAFLYQSYMDGVLSIARV